MQLASLISASRKPGVILAPHWKKQAAKSTVSNTELLREFSKVCSAPVAMAFVSHNIYIGYNPHRPITGLITSLMYHGEVGVDMIAGLDQSQVDQELDIINLLPRKLKVVYDHEEVSVGSMSSNLLMHGKKRMHLLSLRPKSLFDHAWLGCAFSYAKQGLHISSGAAAVTSNGAIFRAGAIEGHVTAREAVYNGMYANGARTDDIVEWVDCDTDSFTCHEWYNDFTRT